MASTQLHAKLSAAIDASAYNASFINNFLDFIIERSKPIVTISAMTTTETVADIIESNNSLPVNDSATPGQQMLAEKYIIDGIEYTKKYECQSGCCTRYIDKNYVTHGVVHNLFDDGEQTYTYKHGTLMFFNDRQANEEHKTIYDADGWSRTDIYLRDHKVICTIQTTNYKNIQSVVTYDDIGNILGKYISGSKSVTLECHSVDASYGLN